MVTENLSSNYYDESLPVHHWKRVLISRTYLWPTNWVNEILQVASQEVGLGSQRDIQFFPYDLKKVASHFKDAVLSK